MGELGRMGAIRVGFSMAVGAERDAVVYVPKGRVPLGLFDGDRPVLGQYFGEGLEVVNVERIFGSGVGAAVLARPFVAFQCCQPPLSVRGKTTDNLRRFRFFPLQAARGPRRVHAAATKDLVNPSGREAQSATEFAILSPVEYLP
jgi:hypothetical protein